MIQSLDGFDAISGRYDALICDIWGVVHNGISPWPDAAEALISFRRAGGVVVMLSNSPRPSAGVQAQMTQIGVPAGAYDSTVTSGDLTRALLGDTPGKKVHHLGPPRDNGIYGGLDIALVAPEDADIALVTGLIDDDTETPEDYDPLLARYRNRGLTMICANPDLVVERGDRLVYCAGALAERYEEQGGTVVWAGKPHAPAYSQALRQISEASDGDITKDRVLAIGDSLRTDIAGGNGTGIETLLIAEGIHTADFFAGHTAGANAEERGDAGLDLEAVTAAARKAGVTPTFVMRRFRR